MTATIEPTAPDTFAGDLVAEQAVIAACLNEPTAIAATRRTLTPDAFFYAQHGVIFEAMTALDDRSQTTDPINVYGELLRRDRLKRGEAGTLFELHTTPYIGDGTPWAIRRVANLAKQRERATLAQRIGQIGQEITDPDVMAQQLMNQLVLLEASIEDHSDDDAVPGLTTWDEFIARPATDNDWVIPGLLDRQEAVMILAAPGVGKSWLSRQIALSVAKGVHPFFPKRRIDAGRSLLVDLENPETTVQRQTRDPYYAIRHLADGEDVGDRGWIWSHTAGLNIRKKPDAALLERVIADVRPDLVCIGSLYNLFARGSSDWDTAAEETIAVLNKLRARYGCAFWIEHHMPKASEGGHRTAPFGSSLWERWPSYGRVISRIGGQAYEFAVFRGDREAGREFPVGLMRGNGGSMPWLPIWDAEELDLIKENFEADRRRAS